MQYVLVTGGSGFIGAHLCERLLASGYAVFCVDNLITGDKKNIEHLLSHDSFKFFLTDVTKPLPSEITSLHIDFLYHLASPASPNKKSKKSYINFPIETMLVNSFGTYQLLELAKVNQSRFLFASTSEIYGDPLKSPQQETYFGNVNPVGVRSVYDEGKRFGEAITMAYVRTHNLDCRIVRIFNTYGPRMQKDDGRVVSNFITQAIGNADLTVYGKGDQTRSFCYVTDMVEGLLKMMFTDGISGQVINLGNPDERTISDLAKLVTQLVGSSSRVIFQDLPDDDPKVRKPDITKAKTTLQWEPKVTLEDGLKKTIEYFRNN